MEERDLVKEPQFEYEDDAPGGGRKMDDRDGLMMTSAMLLLVGMKGSDEEVRKAHECLMCFSDLDNLAENYGQAALALVKLVKDAAP